MLIWEEIGMPAENSHIWSCGFITVNMGGNQNAWWQHSHLTWWLLSVLMWEEIKMSDETPAILPYIYCQCNIGRMRRQWANTLLLPYTSWYVSFVEMCVVGWGNVCWVLQQIPDVFQAWSPYRVGENHGQNFPVHAEVCFGDVKSSTLNLNLCSFSCFFPIMCWLW